MPFNNKYFLCYFMLCLQKNFKAVHFDADLYISKQKSWILLTVKYSYFKVRKKKQLLSFTELLNFYFFS